jgi:nucleotide-binding universal stress UspA family protein
VRAHWAGHAIASGPIKEVRLVTLSNVVLVGVDGSPDSETALKYALAEASRRGARLRVVSTYFPEYSVHGHTQSLSASEPAIEDDVEAKVRRMVEDALADDAVAVPVDIVVAAGPAAAVLIDMSSEVDVLVVGHRGHGGFASMLLGSVGLQCVLHAHSPVIVVRPTDRTESVPTSSPGAGRHGRRLEA